MLASQPSDSKAYAFCARLSLKFVFETACPSHVAPPIGTARHSGDFSLAGQGCLPVEAIPKKPGNKLRGSNKTGTGTLATQ